METDAQRMEALKSANKIRHDRAKLKSDLRSGKRDPLNVLRRIPPYAGGMKVEAFVRSIPKLGPFKSQKLLCRCQIGATTTLEGMTERQRRMLAWSIRERQWL